LLSACRSSPASAANLTNMSVSVADVGGKARTTFSNSETITLRQQVYNAVGSPNLIAFKFIIKNPAGTTVFTHTGNAAPGTPGLSQTQISGLAIASFYATPGNYTFTGEASLDGETVTQEARFSVSSPNITLIYPPSGATGLSDTPLIFRWVGSGASQYRITVGDNPGLYNPVHQSMNAGETFFSYPQYPAGPREQLVPQQVYYWKIEGLDAAGNTISQSNIYNFSLRNQAASQSRNILVSDLSLTEPLRDKTQPLHFKAVVYNAGNSAETNIGLKMSLGGLNAQDSPKHIQTLMAGESTEIPFTAVMPPDQDSSLAAACVDIFDDNLSDNCKTTMITTDAGGHAAAGGSSNTLSYDELWAELKKRLGPDALKALEGYTFQTIECGNCSGSELNDILAALVNGDATLVGASINETSGSAPNTTVQAGQTAAQTSASESSGMDLEVLKPAALTPGEWTGHTEASKETETFVVTSQKDWEKRWKSLSDTPAPVVDFSQNMVIGIISSSMDRVDAVRILSKRMTEKGLTVDYYYIQAPVGKVVMSSAYILKVEHKEPGKVNYRRLDAGVR